MTLAVDLFLLETPRRFEEFCFRLIRAEYGYAVRFAESWDGGRDAQVVIQVAPSPPIQSRTLVLQCKFTKSRGADTKRSIIASFYTFERSVHARARIGSAPVTWILCMPVAPTEPFARWLEGETAKRHIDHQIWGRGELLARLERRPPPPVATREVSTRPCLRVPCHRGRRRRAGCSTRRCRAHFAWVRVRHLRDACDTAGRRSSTTSEGGRSGARRSSGRVLCIVGRHQEAAEHAVEQVLDGGQLPVLHPATGASLSATSTVVREAVFPVA
jgi:hypothetical protein